MHKIKDAIYIKTNFENKSNINEESFWYTKINTINSIESLIIFIFAKSKSSKVFIKKLMG